MKKAIIIGASSGIGREMVLQLVEAGYMVGIAARRIEKLDELKKQYKKQIMTYYMDLSDINQARNTMSKMLEALGKVDFVVLNSGTGSKNQTLDFDIMARTIDVNVMGTTGLATIVYKYFEAQGYGTLVGISSVAGVRGNSYSPSYAASKAYISNYLEGLRCKSKKEKSGITVIDIKPGFIDTAMGQGDKVFWSIKADVAVKQMLKGIQRKKEHIVVPKRWHIIVPIMHLMPSRLYSKI